MEVDQHPKNIIPPSCVLGALSWKLERNIRAVHSQEPDPGGGRQILQSLRLPCHSGVRRTVSFLHRQFLGFSMPRDTQCFVSSCIVCSQNKVSHKPHAGPHVYSDPSVVTHFFVTGLPLSSGKTVVMIVVDCFSKGAQFVALTKLPSAAESAKLIFTHVFRLHSILVDIVSGRGASILFVSVEGTLSNLWDCSQPLLGFSLLI